LGKRKESRIGKEEGKNHRVKAKEKEKGVEEFGHNFPRQGKGALAFRRQGRSHQREIKS